MAALAGSPVAIASDKPIVLGCTTANSGPSAHLGRNVTRGLQWALADVRIGGRPVELRVLDDGYRKDVAAENMKALCDDPDVLAVIGNVGTPTAMVTHPIARDAGLVLFGAVSGADALRQADLGHVWNVRASYAQELDVSIGGLLGAGIRPHEFAFFGQDDGYGDSVYSATRERLGIDIPKATYKRNTSDVEDAARAFWDLRDKPKVIVLAGTAFASGKFMRILKPHMPSTRFVSVSFTALRGLVAALGKDLAEGIIVTQVVPDLHGDTVPAVDAFLADLPAGLGAIHLALEGHIVGSMMVEVLRRAHDAGQLERTGIRETLEGFGAFETDVGAELRLDGNRRQACDTVWPTVIRGGLPRALDFDTLEL